MPPEDEEPDMDPLFLAAIMDENDPFDLLHKIVNALHASDDPNRAVGDLGAGPLETLIGHHESTLWPEIERLARADPLFRRSLRAVWAYDSPEFERRSQLLGELGEWWPVAIRFVVEPQELLPDARVSWRALKIDGEVPAGQLPRVLREIADSCESEQGATGRYVRTMGANWSIYYEWCQTEWALQRAWHRVALADDSAGFRAAKEAVEAARVNEREKWQAFVHAMGYRDEGNE